MWHWIHHAVKNRQYRLSLLLTLSCHECIKMPIPADQVLPLTGYILENSYSTSATQANKIRSMDQSELLNLWAVIGTLTYSINEKWRQFDWFRCFCSVKCTRVTYPRLDFWQLVGCKRKSLRKIYPERFLKSGQNFRKTWFDFLLVHIKLAIRKYHVLTKYVKIYFSAILKVDKHKPSFLIRNSSL